MLNDGCSHKAQLTHYAYRRIIEAALKRRATATVPPQAPPPPQGDSQKSQRPAVSSPHATDQSSRPGPSSEVHSSTSQGDEATHNRVKSTPPSRRPSSIRFLPESSIRMPTPRPDDGGLKEEVQATPGASFASLLQSAKPLGHHVASWGFRSPLSSSPRHAPAPVSNSRPQLSTAPRLVAGYPGGRLRTSAYALLLNIFLG